ncbi:MAG TPA: hypothetical protein VK971_05980 [Thiohalobacter sp.]|nr:hypothetical protein [Thiohalobacter sp.]
MCFRILLLLTCLNTGPALAVDCLEIIDHAIGQPNEGFGLVEIEWQAEVENRCEAAYYASLTLDFLDAEGNRIHRSRTDAVVNPGLSLQVTKLAMLNPDQARQTTATRISLDARALP